MRRHLLGCSTLLMFGLLAFVPSNSSATTIGPDAYGYRATDNTLFSFVDVSAFGTRVLADTDDDAINANIGFTFNFYGTNYTDVWASSNALMTFGSGNGSFGNTNLTSSASPSQPAIAPLWDDWVTFNAADDAVYYYSTIGFPGNRQFIVQWNQVCVFGESCINDTVTFETILFEGSNDILFQYLDVNAQGASSSDNGGSATVGIRDAGGQLNGRNLQWSFNSAVINDGQAIRYSVTAVPEPSALILLGAGLAGLGAVSWRRRK